MGDIGTVDATYAIIRRVPSNFAIEDKPDTLKMNLQQLAYHLPTTIQWERIFNNAELVASPRYQVIRSLYTSPSSACLYKIQHGDMYMARAVYVHALFLMRHDIMYSCDALFKCCHRRFWPRSCVTYTA